MCVDRSDAAAQSALAKTLEAWSQWRVFSPEFIHGLRAAANSTSAQIVDAKNKAEDELAMCSASEEQLARACMLAGAPISRTMSKQDLLCALNLVGASAPEPVEGEPLEPDEELYWRREDSVAANSGQDHEAGS